MPKLKKQPMNAFAFFMKERKIQLERQGYRFPRGLADVVSVVQDEWKNLPPTERARFEKLAKDHKEKEKHNLDNKFTATGEAYSSVQRRMQAEEMDRIEAQTLFRKIVHCPKSTERNYIVMKAISSCEVGLPNGQGGKQVFPLELAIAAFNIKDGYIICYWTLVDTLTIPCGWASTAKETSEETMLPQPGSKLFDKFPASRNYKGIITNIRKFIETWADDYPQKNKKPEYMIFGMAQDIPTIKGSLDWLVQNADDDTRDANADFFDRLMYYSLPELVVELSCLAHELNPSFHTEISQFKLPGSAERLLNYGNYDYKVEITCLFHKDGDNSQKMHLCCKNVVLRRIFLLLEEVAKPGFNCELTEHHRIDTFFTAGVPERLRCKLPRNPSAATPASTSSSSSAISSPSPSTANRAFISSEESDQASTSSLSSTRSSVKRERSPSHNDSNNHHERENSPEPSNPWGSKVKKEAKPNLDEDFPPLGMSSAAPAGRGRGFHSREEPRPPPRELEEGETVSDDDEDDHDDSVRRPVNAPVTHPVSMGRGRGSVASGRHGPGYNRWV